MASLRHISLSPRSHCYARRLTHPSLPERLTTYAAMRYGFPVPGHVTPNSADSHTCPKNSRSGTPMSSPLKKEAVLDHSRFAWGDTKSWHMRHLPGLEIVPEVQDSILYAEPRVLTELGVPKYKSDSHPVAPSLHSTKS